MDVLDRLIQVVEVVLRIPATNELLTVVKVFLQAKESLVLLFKQLRLELLNLAWCLVNVEHQVDLIGHLSVLYKLWVKLGHIARQKLSQSSFQVFRVASFARLIRDGTTLLVCFGKDVLHIDA